MERIYIKLQMQHPDHDQNKAPVNGMASAQ